MQKNLEGDNSGGFPSLTTATIREPLCLRTKWNLMESKKHEVCSRTPVKRVVAKAPPTTMVRSRSPTQEGGDECCLCHQVQCCAGLAKRVGSRPSRCLPLDVCNRILGSSFKFIWPASSSFKFINIRDPKP